MLKRFFDIFCSIFGIVAISWLMLIIAIIIRLGSKGPAIFRQRRAGWKGKPFTMLKFRTMNTDVDPYGNSPHDGTDSRLTKFGKFLRETRIDELPQIFNVLVGQMSLVGPRPLYERQAELWNAHQMRRLEVRPGITGHAQVIGGGEMTHEEKIEHDVWYVDHRSFWLDLRIIIRTIFGDKGGIYERRYSKHQDYETTSSDVEDSGNSPVDVESRRD